MERVVAVLQKLVLFRDGSTGFERVYNWVKTWPFFFIEGLKGSGSYSIKKKKSRKKKVAGSG